MRKGLRGLEIISGAKEDKTKYPNNKVNNNEMILKL